MDHAVRDWIKVAGTGEAPIRDSDWFAVHQRWARQVDGISGFSARPRVEPGDRFVMYAAGSGRVFGGPRIYAVEEVTSWPREREHDRWTWVVETRVVVAGPLLTHAPTLHDIDKRPRSVCSHSHVFLTEEQGRRAEVLIQRAADQHGTPMHVRSMRAPDRERD